MSGIRFFVIGEPQGKARPVVVTGHAYTPHKTVAYERSIRKAYPGTMYPAGVPLRISLLAAFMVPKRATKKARAEMLAGRIRPTKRPDCDNIAKAVLDALNGIAYHDDAQIVGLSISKRYGEVPGVTIEISPVPDDEQ